MNFPANSSKHNDAISLDDQEIFEDSTFLARFEESSFQDETAGPSDSNKSLDKSGFNVSALCCDEEISGYDKLMGRTWIYPTNYPVRDYQFNIIKAALVKNTLVSLPTGLGKTFIAAVVMYNFFRWYPLGKIVFTAPTRPLVAQQIEACYNIIAIPPEESVEMTGTIPVTTRNMHWKSKRVFFATPQVIYNDIKSGVCPADKIRCLVFDEAHRARGNYAYCSIVASLTDMGHKTYRILALSATPGSKVEDVSKVVRNIHIAHLELRTEACMDVAPYSHARRINTVLVALGPALTQLRQRYVEILDSYARRLKQLNILPHNVGNLSKGRVVMLYKEYQNKERGARHPQHNYIMKDFTLLIALYHGLELLVRHGSRVFLNFFDEHPEKTWMQADDRLTALLERLRDDLGVNPATLNTGLLPDGTVPEIPKDISFGHPKFDKLKEIMLQHFKKAKEKGQDTRAIVFCEYRESVSLVHCLLLQCRPLIAPLMFVGQGASGKDGRAAVSQRQQLRAMQRFRGGACNTLVATCVAEEGLDVGSVDLIVCFDVSTRSPVRLVQRCGRTGRERSGQVHILVTEGREHQTLLDCMRQRDGLNRRIQQSREVQQSLFAHSPRMMPRDHTPACQKMYITVKQRAGSSTAAKKGQKDLLSMFAGRQSSDSSGGSTTSIKETKDALIAREEFQELYPEGFVESTPEREVKEYWTLSRESLLALSSLAPRTPRLARWLEWQRTAQRTARVAHARDTCALADLLRLCDAKRFQMPASTQNPSFNTQDIANIATEDVAKSSPVKLKITKKKHKLPPVKSPSKRDGDIRALFSTATKSTKNYTKVIKDLHIPSDGSIPTNLIDLFVDMSVETTNTTKICYLCVNFGDCNFLQNLKKNTTESSFMVNILKDPKFPDLSLIDDIDKATIAKCVTKKVDESELICDHYIEVHDAINNRNTNFDLEFDFGSPDIEDDNDKANDNKIDSSDENFNIGDIEDIFAESSPEEVIKNQLIATDEKNTSDPKQALDFFGLDSIDDIFADSDDEIHSKTNKPETLKQTPDKTNILITSKEISHNLDQPKQNKLPNLPENPPSPSILSGTRKRKMSSSPILCSQQNRRLIKKQSLPETTTPFIKPKQLFTKTSRVDDDIEIIEDNNNKIDATPNAGNITKETSIGNTTDRSMFTITQLVNMINETGEKSELEKSTMSKEEEKSLTAIQLENNDRSCSPILLTQAEKKKPSLSTKKTANLKIRTNASLIVLDSDSDSDLDNTVEYNVEDNNKPETHVTNTNNILNFKSPATTKRKLDWSDDSFNASPFFIKKQKIEETNKKSLSLQEKVIAALSTNKTSDTKTKDNFNEESINFMFTSPMFASQKENLSPKLIEYENKTIENRKKNSVIEALQAFRRDPKAPFPTKFQGRDVSNKFSKPVSQKREITFDDSDDDFVDNEVRLATQKTQRESDEKPLVNHKRNRKKLKPKSDFLELEAELSGDSPASGDELTDDSAGSLAEFICDAPVPDASAADIQALYLESVRSPIRGVFKIPQLPQKFRKEDILSQYVEEDDAYEMDSFCVDSHIGLTQLHDESESELELAEQKLEKRRRARRKVASHNGYSTAVAQTEDVDSPVVKRKTKVKRQICSDSDDSS